MYKKLSLLIFFVVFLVSACAIEPRPSDSLETVKNRKKLIVGVKYDALPFGFVDTDGKLVGADIEITQEIAERLLGDRTKVEFRKVTPATRIQALTSDEVDFVAATMSITPAREQILNFSDSYYKTGMAVMVRDDSDIKTLSDLNEKRILVILGTTGEKTIRLYAPKAILVGCKTYESAYKSMRDGHADALVTDEALLIGFVIQNRQFRILPKVLTEEYYAIAFKKAEETENLRKQVNIILNSMRNDGTLNEIQKKWGLK